MDHWKGHGVGQTCQHFGLLNIQLSPIWPLVKEFLQTIILFNYPDIIESFVEPVPIFVTKKIVAEMFHLPKLGIIKLSTN
jgi:hypothetical protein